MKWKLEKGAALALSLLLAACELRQAMYDTGRIKPLEKSEFFADDRSARVPPEGTIARGRLFPDDPLHTGRAGGKLVAKLPIRLDDAGMKRGRELYRIYCSVCHGHVGTGNGMVVQRGYSRPPSLHEERLRAAPDGHFFEVMTNGFGVMPSYRAMLPPVERWLVVAYLRALQLSQSAGIQDVPAAARQRLLEEARP